MMSSVRRGDAAPRAPSSRERPRLDALASEHPDWAGWLALLAVTRREIDEPAWTRAVQASPAPAAGAPDALLHRRTIDLDPRLVDRWIRRLFDAGAAVGQSELRAASRATDFDAVALLGAALGQDTIRIGELADRFRMTRASLLGIAPLVAAPLLHACQRAWRAQVPRAWERGTCPVCAAWPTLVEARGLERERRLRCARCGSDWWIEWLRCPYCGARDHTALRSLAPDGTRETRKIETCARCHGYVKTLTTLVPIPPADLFLEDLTTIDLDVVALDHGYRRPEPPPLELHVERRPAGLRGWFGSRS